MRMIPLVLIFISFNLYAYKDIAKDPKAMMVGTVLKNQLEQLHYRKSKVNDEHSVKAFQAFLKKIDYSKQFLLQSDIDALKKYEKKMDDQLVSGNHKLAFEAMQVLKKRVHTVENFRKKFFKKKDISFKAKEEIELDPKKRVYLKDEAELQELWRKIFKQSVLTRYLSIEEEQNTPEDEKEKKKNKKKKKEKKLSDKEMRKKAVAAINKKYKKYFSRILKEEFKDQLDKFFNAITEIYDPHTAYMSPKKKEDFDIDISGQLEGIGAVLTEDESYIKVVKVIPGGPAWKQKQLEVDDIILLVTQDNGEVTDLVDMRVGDAVGFIRGPKDSIVKLTVKKVDGMIKVIPIKRDVVQIEENFAKSSVLEHEELGNKVGYIHFPKFYRDFRKNSVNVTNDVRMELIRLKKSKVTGVILDLRNNGGGALEDARLISGLFIDKGPIVQVKNYQGEIDINKDDDGTTLYDGPLIVLINQFSASASEIVAAALQDYGRAVIVGGEFTHGKGTVQAVAPLQVGGIMGMSRMDLGAMRTTIQKFYRINGGSTQFKGVTPDIVLPDPYSYSESREQELEHALPWDKISALSYKKWKKHKFDILELKARSAKRVNNDKDFERIQKSVKYLKERREDTTYSLNIDEVKKENEKNKKISEKFKIDEVNNKITVSNVDASLLAHTTYKPTDKDKKWKEEFKERKKEWVEALQKDPILEESLFIMNDLIHQIKGEKLTMIK